MRDQLHADRIPSWPSRRDRLSRFAAAVLAAPLLSCVPAHAKVAFTGYGDFELNAQGRFRVDGPPSVLNVFSIGAGPIETRNAGVNALGIFATTQVNDNTRLAMDVTYQNIGTTVKTLRVQYGYMEYTGLGARYQAGKIILPFGYYNENKFYPFQRPSITSPIFLTSFLGLPLADIGGSAEKSFEAGDAVVKADVYAVNGYQSLSGSTVAFRSATLPGGLTFANNISGASSNHHMAVGGRLDFSHKQIADSSVGASYYRGYWDPAGSNLFQMAGAHVHCTWAGFNFMTEYLHLENEGDQGMAQNFGSFGWKTDGFFSKFDYHRFKVFEKELTPWVRFEDYFTHGASAGKGREALWGAAGGAALQISDNLTAKAEFNDLYYSLPFQNMSNLIIRGYSLLLGLTVTF